MKIGINGRFLTKPFTGIGQYTFNLVYEMAKANSSNEYLVLVPKKIEQKFPKNVKVKVLAEKNLKMSGAKKTWWEQIQVPEILKDEKVDLAWFPYPSNPWTKDWHKNGPKTVVSIHDCIPWIDKRYRPGVLSKMYHSQSKKAVKKADLVLTVSEASLNDIVDVCDVPREKIEVVYNDAAAAYKKVPNKKYVEKILGRFSLQNSEYFLYVGGYDERKNVKELVAAWKDFGQASMVLVGGKVVEKNLYKSFDVAHGGGLVKTGFLKDEELNVLYRNAKAFVHLSEKEGFNIPILEAANCGTPMILSNIPVHKEVAENAAIFVENRDETLVAMRKMLDGKQRVKYCEKSKKLAKKYDWTKYAKIVAKLFEMDTFEDLVLGHLAKERDENSSEKDFVSSEDVEKS